MRFIFLNNFYAISNKQKNCSKRLIAARTQKHPVKLHPILSYMKIPARTIENASAIYVEPIEKVIVEIVND